MKKSFKVITLVAAATLVVGVAVAPASQAAKIKTCLALDTGGVDDHSFNASAWAGAQASSNISSVQYLPATAAADFAPNIKKFVDQKCDLIIGVGFSISGAIVDSAKKNPTIKYAVVDDQGYDHGPKGDQYPGKAVKNVKGLTFATNENSFMAGYLAAGYSKTGKVATYGGAPYPTVTIFMDGFAKGVAYYNTVHKKNVQTLGWDPKNPSAGTFVGDFQNMNKALSISTGFEQQGADVIFPVAGGLGGATAKNSKDHGKSVTIWVDSDGYNLVPQYASVLLTSVTKGIGNSVKSAISDVAANKFTNASYVGTLANKGVALAPYHDLGKKVPGQLQNEVRQLGKDIASGKVSAK